MKRWYGLAGLAAVIVTCMLWSGAAYAHVLATDGDIGAILHIKPDDDPKSGVPVDYSLSFQDTTNRFKLTDCTCTILIQEDGATVGQSRLAASGELESNDTFTFPRPGIYALQVTGQPKAPGAFDVFSITYTVRVTSPDEATRPQSVPILLYAGMAAAVGLVLLAAYALELRYTEKQ